MKRKRILAIILSIIMIFGNCVSVFADEEAGWKKTEDGRYYYLDEDGSRVVNDIKQSGNQYFYLGEDGYMVVGQGGLTVTLPDGSEVTLRDDGSVEREVPVPIKYREGWNGFDDENGKWDGWVYCEEDLLPYTDGIKIIDGRTYLFENERLVEQRRSHYEYDGNTYYIQSDYELAKNRWIPYETNWYYFAEDAAMVTESMEWRGENYTFDNNGKLTSDNAPYGRVKEVILHPDEVSLDGEAVNVGDMIEIPFEVTIATSSDAEEEYSVASVSDALENAYDISHSYRADRSNDPEHTRLVYEIETRFQMDPEEMVIRVPIEYAGRVYGNLQIDGKRSEKFEYKCEYSKDIPIEDTIDNIITNGRNESYILDELVTLPKDELEEVFLQSKEMGDKIAQLEIGYNKLNFIKKTENVGDNLKKKLDWEKISLKGIGLSANKGGDLTINMDISSKKLPNSISSKYKTVAIDILPSGAGIDVNNMKLPVIVTLPIPETFDAEKVKLFHIHDDEKPEEMTINVDSSNGELTFVTSRFSTFILAEEKTGSQGGGSSSGGGGGGGGSKTTTAQTGEVGTWVQDQTGWWFKRINGTYPASAWIMTGGNWFQFNDKGYMVTGWFTDVDGKKFYLNPTTGSSQGVMMTGWQLIEEKWYYFNTTSDGTKGALLVNGTTPDGFAVGADGVWIQK